jgi:hypothetical protein
MNKKAVSPWIAYVLLIGFVVALSAFVYSWITGYTVQTTEDVKERIYNSDLCDSLGVSMVACINTSTSQDLYINVTNRGDLRITKLVFRFIQMRNTSVEDIYDIEIDNILKPQHTKNLSAEQLNLTWEVDGETIVEAIPATEKENFLIVCNNRKGEALFQTC